MSYPALSYLNNKNQAWALWWLDVVIAVATCFYLPFVMWVFLKHLLILLIRYTYFNLLMFD